MGGDGLNEDEESVGECCESVESGGGKLSSNLESLSFVHDEADEIIKKI